MLFITNDNTKYNLFSFVNALKYYYYYIDTVTK